jgi:uncharacterized membrane protein
MIVVSSGHDAWISPACFRMRSARMPFLDPAQAPPDRTRTINSFVKGRDSRPSGASATLSLGEADTGRTPRRETPRESIMFESKQLSATTAALALAGAVAVTGLAMAPTAQAADTKCYGVAKAGENDCANAAGTHSCAGQATVDYHGGDWKKVESAEACTEMGGKTEPFEGINPEKA